MVLVDADGKKIDALSEEPAFSWRIFASNDKGVLLGSEKLLYAYLTGSKRLEQLSGEAGTEVYSSHEVSDGWLVSTRRGLYKIEFPKLRVSALRGPAPGAIAEMQTLKNGDWLLRAKNGLFRVDAGLKSVDRIGGAAPGEIHAFRALKDGGALVGAERGLFHIDAEAQSVSPVEGSALADVTSLYPLANGDWLAVGQGVARVDASGRSSAPVAVASPAAGLAVQPLPQGGVLFGTPKGVSIASDTLADAKIQVVNAGSSGAMVWSLRHPCAAAAESLGLMIEARPASAPGAAPRTLRVGGFEPDGDEVRFTTNLSSLPPGDWSLRLVSSTGGGATPIGAPVAFSHRESGWDWIRRHAVWLIGGAAALGLMALAGLLVAARWRSGALRMLRHPVSKIAFWPALLFRFSSAARLWVLAPWYARMRAATPTDRPFYDVPVAGPEGAESTAMGLLALAGKQRRLWLRGPLGMGKTEVLAAWRRAFFADRPTLEDAVKAHGFLLAPISAHAFADVGVDPRAPETAVVEALRRSFAEADFPIDRALLRILLRKGRLMVAIDDATEADRDGPIAAFVRAYPETRLAVASRSMAPDGFDMWRLPTQASPHMERWLSLWLGVYSGPQLAARAAREGLTADLVSAFDARLLADLVTANPSRSLPATRSGLYQAMLDQVTPADGTIPGLTGSRRSPGP